MTSTLDILARLVAFDTITDGPNGDLIDYVDSLLRARGFTTRRIADPDHDRAGLFARIGPADGAGVLLSGHSDVVPVAGQRWTRDPFRLSCEGGRAYGRGTTDMKGFVASVLALTERLDPTRLREPLRIVLSYDEEIGCVGLHRMRDRLAPLLGQPRACIVGEPTQMQVATGHKGKAALRAICHGQAGHSALAPHFVNALHLAGDFMAALRALQAEQAETGARDPAYAVPYTSFHVGMLSGGRALNIVPDRAELRFEFRHLAADHSADILRRIRDAADRTAAPYRAQCPQAGIELLQDNAYPGLDVADTDPVVTYARTLTQSRHTTKVAFGTEAGIFHDLGIPTVVCGPGSMQDQGHKPDEYVTLDQLAACDAMMDRVADDLMR
ncbi:MAG: acetylornithine deacetylase [Marinibacterium sp.]|nr:acetylornithine deacetylase [Marinibacterium sp.]